MLNMTQLSSTKFFTVSRSVFDRFFQSSDGTLNPNGVRFGSAEIYNIVNPTNFEEIVDSLCVGQETNKGERVVLFLKMADGIR